MAQAVSISVSDEVKVIIDGIVKAYVDRNGGVAVIGADLVPVIMAILGSLALLGKDFLLPDNIAYVALSVAKAVIPPAA